jgi:hypothetical protein
MIKTSFNHKEPILQQSPQMKVKLYTFANPTTSKHTTCPLGLFLTPNSISKVTRDLIEALVTPTKFEFSTSPTSHCKSPLTIEVKEMQ